MATTRRLFLASSSAIVFSLVARQYFLNKNTRYLADPETSNRSHQPDYSETVAYSDSHVVDNLIVQPGYSKPKSADLILGDQEFASLQAALDRLRRLQSFVGYANFNVISWDQSLKFARNYPGIGTFEKSELDFIEQIFSTEVDRMGFYGEKVVTQIRSTIRRNDIKKIPGTGHYLFKGDSIRTYEKIRRDIGDDIILTSGIRGVVKQIYLFLKKTSDVGGNLSTASFSLAPPGHSFHAVGDFDVGKVSFGKRNFTAAFAATDEFKKLSDLGYIDIRYPQNNPLGVRYEPWHIKVV